MIASAPAIKHRMAPDVSAGFSRCVWRSSALTAEMFRIGYMSGPAWNRVVVTVTWVSW